MRFLKHQKICILNRWSQHPLALLRGLAVLLVLSAAARFQGRYAGFGERLQDRLSMP